VRNGSGKLAARYRPDSSVHSYADALATILAEARPGPTETVALESALGTVSAAALHARAAVPPFDNAAMDGFAVHSARTARASATEPVRFLVSGSVAAGQSVAAVEAGNAMEIATGAILPSGADAVIPVERVTRDADGRISLGSPVAARANVRDAGSDFAAGALVLDAGVRIRPQHVMALAAAGVRELTVRRGPRVGILTTGSELSPTAAARIEDCNGPYLEAWLPTTGARVGERIVASDDAGQLRAVLAKLANTHDVILSTGGVSAGRLDLVPQVVHDLGGAVYFHKVAIRPGKPILMARLPNGALLFGLPGNPVAVAVGMRFLVTPALRALQGLTPEAPVPARLRSVVRGRGALRFFAKAHIEAAGDGSSWVEMLAGQESFRIAPLLRANCWAVVPEGVEALAAGTVIDTWSL
jgi:molybdopterin molybdotransferase